MAESYYFTFTNVCTVLCIHLLCWSPHRLQLPAAKQECISIDYELCWCSRINIHLHL